MNIWALAKDLHLKHLLLVLSEKFGAEAILLGSEWRDDHAALALLHRELPGVMAHVFTWGQTSGHFGVHLEFPAHPDSDPDAVATGKEEISLHELVEILAAHLDLQPRSP